MCLDIRTKPFWRPSKAFGRTKFTHFLDSPFTPGRLTGGGHDHKLLGLDTEMVDVFSAEEITNAKQLFNPEEWVGTGKTWSATLPLHVRLAFADEQKVPTWMIDHILQPQVSVSDLYATALPFSSLVSLTALPSASPPTVFVHPASEDHLLDHQIFFAGKVVLAALKEVRLEQAWLSGCKSIGFDGTPN